ncbi:hypothetical protein GGR46_003359 [Sphingomonas kyeonggiensis]|uniref:Uncharacterized protein n=1 Tax=Sphingomonas kyeonggiensis TaxID=1268553 RepID=A0A7W6NXL4_9SPHN|nr:hypothetical protein [Sphingomonas kyeonggiensis]MBB4099787.1 hypothetical protein [Sphingomonas kyeonggiensis]
MKRAKPIRPGRDRHATDIGEELGARLFENRPPFLRHPRAGALGRIIRLDSLARELDAELFFDGVGDLCGRIKARKPADNVALYVFAEL